MKRSVKSITFLFRFDALYIEQSGTPQSED